MLGYCCSAVRPCAGDHSDGGADPDSAGEDTGVSRHHPQPADPPACVQSGPAAVLGWDGGGQWD